MKIIFLSLVIICSATFGLSQTEDCAILLPSVFVTDEDEFGAERKVLTIELPCPVEKITVQLLNRWGKTLIEKEELNVEGHIKLDGTNLKPQTLICSVVVKINNEEQKYYGNVRIN